MNLFASILNRKSVGLQKTIAEAQLSEVVTQHAKAVARLVASVRAVLDTNATIRIKLEERRK